MDKIIRQFLKANSIEIKKFSDSELFNLYLKAHEGLNLSYEITDRWLNFAKSTVKNSISPGYKSRLNELKSGDVNLGDFEDGRQLAVYLETGVWK